MYYFHYSCYYYYWYYTPKTSTFTLILFTFVQWYNRLQTKIYQPPLLLNR